MRLLLVTDYYSLLVTYRGCSNHKDSGPRQ